MIMSANFFSSSDFEINNTKSESDQSYYVYALPTGTYLLTICTSIMTSLTYSF